MGSPSLTGAKEVPQSFFDRRWCGFKAVHRLLVDEFSAELVYDRNYSESAEMLLTPPFRYRLALDPNEAFGL